MNTRHLTRPKNSRSLLNPKTGQQLAMSGADQSWQVERAEMTLASSPFYADLRQSLRKGFLWSVVPFLLLVFGLTFFPIPGAVISSGFLVSETSAKQIQAPETAVIRSILVADGDTVSAGQTLIQLDDTLAMAEMLIIQQSIDRLEARSARLGAEALGLDAVEFPETFVARMDIPAVATIAAAERELFGLRLATHTTQLDQMGEQTIQIEEQVRGVMGQVAAVDTQYRLATEQSANLSELASRNLIERTRMVEAQQLVATLEGQSAQFNATIALARARQAELNSQIAEIGSARMSEAASEQRDTLAELANFYEQRIAATKRVELLRLVAPEAGIVSELQVRTVGGVVSASEQLMTITPTGDQLIAEMRVDPRDAPSIYFGQPAELHFSAIGGSNAPQFSGNVLYISPDVAHDQRTGISYFTVRAAMDQPINQQARELQDLGPGMPVEVFLLKEAQPIFAYVARPVIEQARRAFR
jgi:HlyD family secretion protein